MLQGKGGEGRGRGGEGEGGEEREEGRRRMEKDNVQGLKKHYRDIHDRLSVLTNGDSGIDSIYEEHHYNTAEGS